MFSMYAGYIARILEQLLVVLLTFGAVLLPSSVFADIENADNDVTFKNSFITMVLDKNKGATIKSLMLTEGKSNLILDCFFSMYNEEKGTWPSEQNRISSFEIKDKDGVRTIEVTIDHTFFKISKRIVFREASPVTTFEYKLVAKETTRFKPANLVYAKFFSNSDMLTTSSGEIKIIDIKEGNYGLRLDSSLWYGFVSSATGESILLIPNKSYSGKRIWIRRNGLTWQSYKYGGDGDIKEGEIIEFSYDIVASKGPAQEAYNMAISLRK